jgi:hypothetical protein
MTVESLDPTMPSLYMVVEHFKNKDAAPAYRRFRDRGRMMPEGLMYVSSWIDLKLERCFQLMETNDRSLLDKWIANWSDIIDFEVYPVVTSKQAVEMINPRL